MAQTPEAKVKQFVRDQIKKEFNENSWMVSPVSRGMGSRGVPDYLFCIHGVFVAIECKADETKKPTPLQEIQLEKIRNAGGLALVVKTRDSWFIDTIKQHIGQVRHEVC